MTLPKSDSTEAASAIASVAEKPLTRYAMQPVSMTVNGRSVGPIRVPEQLMLIDFLHEYLGLTGSRLGCGQGVCHACVVILDNADGSSEEVRSCITGASSAARRSTVCVTWRRTRPPPARRSPAACWRRPCSARR